MDITMCKSKNCPIKDKCYRYTAKASLMQSYFVESPSTIKDGKFSCDMFWGDNYEKLIKKL